MALTSLEGNTKRTVKEARAVWNDPDFQLSDKPQLSELQITKTVVGGPNASFWARSNGCVTVKAAEFPVPA